MTPAFQPLGPNYLISATDDSSLALLEISDTNSVGTVWQLSNLGPNIAYVNISTQEFDGGAYAPGAAAGQGTPVLVAQSVFVDINVTGVANGPVYVSVASDGTSDVIVVPGSWQ